MDCSLAWLFKDFHALSAFFPLLSEHIHRPLIVILNSPLQKIQANQYRCYFHVITTIVECIPEKSF